MSSLTYWRKREEEALKYYAIEETEYDSRIEGIYLNMMNGVQTEIDAFYGKYAQAEHITLAEAKKRVSKLDIEAYERKAKKYVTEAAQDRKLNGGKTNFKGRYFSEKANEEMRLYNATMKINRLELLKANIGLEMVKGHAELEGVMGEILEGRALSEYKRMAGILGETVKNNAQKAHAIANASFRNATFSERIWQYHGMMKADMDKLLQTGLIQGKNPRVLARELRRYYMGDERLKNGKSGAIYNTERLMRTELARVQTEAQKQSFERNGFTQYMFIANGDCCDMCRPLNGKHFDVEKMMPGENAPPMHPNCRCSVAAYEDGEEYKAWLDYLDKGGTTAQWNETGLKAWKNSQRAKGEKEKQYGFLYGETAKAVDWEYINSQEYKEKFSHITNDEATNNEIYKAAMQMLKHRDNTEYEDLYLLDKNGRLLAKVTDSGTKRGINYTPEYEEALRMAKDRGTYTIAIHNHPQGTPPSPDDFRKAFENQYGLGVVVGHNGQVYVYSNRDVEISASNADAMADNVAFFYEHGIDIDRASKMVYDADGIGYMIIEGGEKYA